MKQNTQESIQKRINQLNWKAGIAGISAEMHIAMNWHIHCYENYARIRDGGVLTDELMEIVRYWNSNDRTKEEYILDMLIAWLGEEMIEKELGERLYFGPEWMLYRDGTDKERKFVKPSEARADPDLTLYNFATKKKIGIEIMEDNSGFIKRKNKLDLRYRVDGTSKFEDLVNKSKQEDYIGVFLIVKDWANRKLGVLWIDEHTKINGVKYNYSYKCNATEIPVDYKKMFDSNLKELQDLIDMN